MQKVAICAPSHNSDGLYPANLCDRTQIATAENRRGNMKKEERNHNYEI